MRLCIPIEPRPEGGVYTFVENLTTLFEGHGIAYTRDLAAEYDVLFANSWVVPYRAILSVKRSRPGVRVVHRVDGSAVDYGRTGDADARQARVNLLADVTIFQSQYSRYSTREKYRVIANDGPVIYNPVDPVRFRPVAAVERGGVDRVRVVTAAFSTNRMKGAWQIDQLAADHPDIDFVVAGPSVARSSTAPNVQRLGYLPRPALADLLRACDMFLNLSENDPCPNVVLEALASGLPILYRASGGVPELVGDCGVAIDLTTFRTGLERLLDDLPGWRVRARARAVDAFSPDVIFPKYLEAIDAATRQALPTSWRIARLTAAGYPVAPRPSLAGVRAWAGAALRGAGPFGSRKLAQGTASRRIRVGWITYDSFQRRKFRFASLEPASRMRAGNIGQSITRHDSECAVELYRRERQYDAVVFQKVMGRDAETEARRIQAYGGKVVFDANVNYYDRWGDYFVPGTRPTDDQQRDAIAMTQLADCVVADSSELGDIARRFATRVVVISDNVNLDVYSKARRHANKRPVTLVWSGVGKKAAHLLMLRDVFDKIDGIELLLVTDDRPDCLSELEAVIPVRVERFSDERYAALLAESDVIVSPKRLVNAYEMGHTEYKIALGMAAGLPAIASPQRSYVEAISHLQGGIIATTTEEWMAAIERLGGDVSLRTSMGERARQTVVERYATPVVARQYLDVLKGLMASADSSALVPEAGAVAARADHA